MALCATSTVQITLIDTGLPYPFSAWRFDIIHTPAGCTLAGSNPVPLLIFDIATDQVVRNDGTTFYPTDTLHGGPPWVDFVSISRITIPLAADHTMNGIGVGVFTVTAFDQNTNLPFTMQVFWPTIPHGGGSGFGCDSVVFANQPGIVTLQGQLGSGPGPLAWTITSFPTHGSFSGIAPDLLYTPNPGFVGTDTFSYKVNDGANDSLETTAKICVLFNSVVGGIGGC